MTRKSAWLVLGVVATLLSPMWAAHRRKRCSSPRTRTTLRVWSGIDRRWRHQRRSAAGSRRCEQLQRHRVGTAGQRGWKLPAAKSRVPRAGQQPAIGRDRGFQPGWQAGPRRCQSTSNTISVLPGNGDGTFQPALTLTAGTAPGSVAAGDFNGDGNPDLAAANSGSNDVSVLLGNGNGTFQAVRTFAADSGPAFVGLGDFNRDGRPDLAIANTGPVPSPSCWATETGTSKRRGLSRRRRGVVGCRR